MRSLEGLWFEDMEKKRKKKSGVDFSKTMASPSGPPSVDATATTATPPPIEVATATPPPVEATTDVSATKVAEVAEAAPPPAAPPPPTSTPALSEASAEAVLAKVDLAKVAVPRSSSKLVAAVELPPDPPARPEPRSEPTEVSVPAALAPTPTPAIEVVTATPSPVAVTETPPPVSAAGGPVSKKKSGKKKKKGDRASVLPATTREPALERASKRKIAAAPDASVPKAELDQKLEKLDQKLQEKKVEAEKAARAGFASTPDADDISVPPVDLDEHDDRFFAAGEGAAHRAMPGASGSYDAVDPHHARKMTAEAKARRAHLTRYVKGAVIACAAVLALGLLVNKLRTKDEPTPTVSVTHAPLPQPPPPIPTPTQTADTPPPDDTAVVTPDTSASAAASAAPDTSASAATTASAAPDTSAKPAKPALQEKLDAKALLEREAYGAAVAAGERSVALDSSDGEAWLILGAAYQGMGNQGQAKRCYQTCTKQKRGPISDCQQMLQQ